jgi:hypothetical protein
MIEKTEMRSNATNPDCAAVFPKNPNLKKIKKTIHEKAAFDRPDVDILSISEIILNKKDNHIKYCNAK